MNKCDAGCKYFENSFGLYLCLSEEQRQEEYEYFSPYFDKREVVLPCPFYIDSESKDEKSKTVFRNARRSGKSLTMAGLK